MKKLLFLVCCALLAACSTNSDHEDLAQWMSESARDLKGKVAPLPQVKPYEPVAYATANVLDPFNSSKILPDRKPSGGGNPPDFTRPREPLESYPLETLKYVGVITREKDSYALILADRALYQVGVNNYLGQNFGKITKIDESEVSLTEFVQNAEGDWIERTSFLHLQGAGQEVMK
jgi:type IV pilus assembly protein PilP